jgi:hypothetical protein
MSPQAPLPRMRLTGAEAQVFHRCIRRLAGERQSDWRAMKTSPAVPLARRREINDYAERIWAVAKSDA